MENRNFHGALAAMPMGMPGTFKEHPGFSLTQLVSLIHQWGTKKFVFTIAMLISADLIHSLFL